MGMSVQDIGKGICFVLFCFVCLISRIPFIEGGGGGGGDMYGKELAQEYIIIMVNLTHL